MLYINVQYGKYCKFIRKEYFNINIKKNFCIIFFIFLFNIFLSKPIYCSTNFLNEDLCQNLTSNSQNTISDVSDKWNKLEDNELNEVIANSTPEELSEFLQELNEEETEEILDKDTMLNNTINQYEAEDTEEEISNQVLVNSEPYYQYLLDSDNLNATKISTTEFTSKKGNFFIQISGNGKTTKKLILVELSSTDISKEQTVKFSEVDVSGYTDNHNFQITTATSKTKLTDNYYTILSMEFSYTKPSHYIAYGDYSDKVDGYRFNFKKYSLDNSGSSTVNNTGHNTSETTEKISLQINVANCGINQSTNHYVASSATGYIKLSKKYYSSLQINPNGGNHNDKTSTYTYGTKICGTVINIENPTRYGYKFTGWTISKGSCCSGASFNSVTKKFTYCGESTTNSNVSSNNICVLKANWERIYGTIIVQMFDKNGNKITDGIYSLYDSGGNLIKTIKSGANNEIKFINLPVGIYTIYEEQIQKGYELIKTKGEKVKITESNTNNIVTFIYDKKMILPKAGGKRLNYDCIIIGFILVLNIIIRKNRRNI